MNNVDGSPSLPETTLEKSLFQESYPFIFTEDEDVSLHKDTPLLFSKFVINDVQKEEVSNF